MYERTRTWTQPNVLSTTDLAEGANAEAEPTRAATMMAADFMVGTFFVGLGEKVTSV